MPDLLCRCARSALQHLDDIFAIPARQPAGMTHPCLRLIMHAVPHETCEEGFSAGYRSFFMDASLMLSQECNMLSCYIKRSSALHAKGPLLCGRCRTG